MSENSSWKPPQESQSKYLKLKLLIRVGGQLCNKPPNLQHSESLLHLMLWMESIIHSPTLPLTIRVPGWRLISQYHLTYFRFPYRTGGAKIQLIPMDVFVVCLEPSSLTTTRMVPPKLYTIFPTHVAKYLSIEDFPHHAVLFVK